MFDAQDKAELFNNYFNSVFKSDDCDPLHEDCFLVIWMLVLMF